MVNELDISGLVGIEYCTAEEIRDPLKACDCWALVRLAAYRPPAGVKLPVDPAELLVGERPAAVEVVDLPRVLDLVEIRGDIGAHVGIVARIDGSEGQVLHQTKYGSRIDRLSVLERAGVVVRRVRLRAVSRVQELKGGVQ